MSEYLHMTAELTGLKYSIVASLLSALERHIRENAELSAEIRNAILKGVKTVQAQLLLNAVFDLRPFPLVSGDIR